MKNSPSARTRRIVRVVHLMTLLAPCPLAAYAQDSAHEREVDAAAPNETPPEPTLTPPRLAPDLDLQLPELPVGSAPIAAILELTVGVDGSASDPVVLVSAGPDLDRAALASVTRLRFAPALRGDEPIPARISFRFDFRASEPPPPPPPAPAGAEPTVEAITLDVQGERPARATTAHVVDTTEIRKLPGTNGDPIRAVENMPGVARPPFAIGQLVIRGSAPEDSVVFIDGIEVPFAYHLGGLASVIPSDALSKLDFRPGNYGPEYGRAMGGVVEISLREPRRDRFGAILQLDNIDGRVLVEGPLGARTRFLAAARRSWLDTWVGKMDEDISAAPVYYDGQAILEHDFNQRTTARLFFLAADNKMRLLFDEPDSDDLSESGKLGIATRFTRLGVRVESRFSDALNLRTTVAWGVNRFHIDEGRSYQRIKSQSIELRSELRARFKSWLSGAVGVDARAALFDVELRSPPYPSTDEVDAPAFGRPSLYFDEQKWLLRPAVYAALELSPVDALRIVPSVRGEYLHDTGEFVVDPRLSVRADVHPGFPRTTLKAGIGVYTQPPLPQESIEPFGTPGVEANRSLHSSFGIEQELAHGLELSMEGFYKQLWNLVVARAAEDEADFGVRFGNSGQGRVYGGEALLRYRSEDSRFFGWLAYTLSRSERRSDDSEPYHLFQYDQTHILTALGNVELGRGFSAGARFRYVTGSPYTPYIGGVLDLDAGSYAPVPGATYSGRLPAFHTLDVRLDKTFLLGAAKLVAYLELRNAYNRKNAEQIDYRYDYEASRRIEGLPILPSIGLRGEL
jgi:hypothetical protein